MNVAPDRALRDVQSLGDLTIGDSLRDKVEDLALANRQSVDDSRLLGGRIGLDEQVDQAGQGFRAEDGLSLSNETDRLDQVSNFAVLGDAASRTSPNRLVQEVRILAVVREDEDIRTGNFVADFSSGLEDVATGDMHVDQDHVWMELASLFESAPAVGNLGDDV